MHRRRHIIRRFGPLDFGIGSYDDGVWVDHAADTAHSVPASLEVVHAWLGCCDGTSAEPIAVGDSVPEGPLLHVAAR